MKTAPRLAPTCKARVVGVFTICHAVRNSRSSSWPPVRGAPATIMILPPSRSRSDSRNVTPCRAHECWTFRTQSSRAAASAVGPASASNASVPENRTNPTATLRCSAPNSAARRYSRTGGDRAWSRSAPAAGADSIDRSVRVGSATSSDRSATRSTHSAGSAAAVSGESAISPGRAAVCSSAVRDAAGPHTINSRCTWGSPTRKNVNRPECRPADSCSVTAPRGVRTRPKRSRRTRIRAAARAARAGCCAPSKSSSTASPPHLSRNAPSRLATSSKPVNNRSSTSVSSSAPTLPRPDSRSVSRVKPEMSSSASVPSTSRYAVSGSAASQARTRRGTKGARDRVVVLEGTIAWLQGGRSGCARRFSRKPCIS